MSLFKLVCLSLLLLSSANALVADRAQVVRHVQARDAVAARKRDSPTCQPRPSSSPPPASTPTPTPTPSPTSSPSPSSSPASTPSSGSNQKYCLAWGADPSFLPNFNRPKVNWLYNWDSTKPDNLEFPYAIMLWGNDQTRINNFQANAVAGYSTLALGQNEPNEPSQSNLTPQEAFDVWMQYINPLHSKGYTLYSPACTDDASGKVWYQEFFQLCKSNPACVVDVIAFHAYTVNAADLISYATDLHNTYNMPVAITEFADQNFSGVGGEPDMGEVWAFAAQVVDFVDNTDWLVSACPFGLLMDMMGVDANNQLITPAGYPTDLAYYYLG